MKNKANMNTRKYRNSGPNLMTLISNCDYLQSYVIFFNCIIPFPTLTKPILWFLRPVRLSSTWNTFCISYSSSSRRIRIPRNNNDDCFRDGICCRALKVAWEREGKGAQEKEPGLGRAFPFKESTYAQTRTHKKYCNFRESRNAWLYYFLYFRPGIWRKSCKI